MNPIKHSQNPHDESQFRFEKNKWKAVALCACAIAALAFIGWAPIDKPDTEEQRANDFDLLNDDLLIGDVINSIDSSQGDKPFQPSGLDWLALRANAELRVEKWAEHGFNISYVSEGRGTDTIKVLVVYDVKRAKRDKINKEVDFVKKMLHQTAQQHEFEKWLNVTVEYVPFGS